MCDSLERGYIKYYIEETPDNDVVIIIIIHKTILPRSSDR